MNTKLPLKIMIADDDHDDRELLQFLFDKNDMFELVGCFSLGSQVIDEIIIKKNIPDALIIDRYMPELSGIEVLEKLIESKVASHLNTFIISSTINQNEQEQFATTKFLKFIKKPISLVEINDFPGMILECLNHKNNTVI